MKTERLKTGDELVEEYEQRVHARRRGERGSAFFILYVVACATIWIGGVIYASYLQNQIDASGQTTGPIVDHNSD